MSSKCSLFLLIFILNRNLAVNNHFMLICVLIVFFFRQQALEIERLRAAKITALPPPVDPIEVRLLVQQQSKFCQKDSVP